MGEGSSAGADGSSSVGAESLRAAAAAAPRVRNAGRTAQSEGRVSHPAAPVRSGVEYDRLHNDEEAGGSELQDQRLTQPPPATQCCSWRLRIALLAILALAALLLLSIYLTTISAPLEERIEQALSRPAAFPTPLPSKGPGMGTPVCTLYATSSVVLGQ